MKKEVTNKNGIAEIEENKSREKNREKYVKKCKQKGNERDLQIKQKRNENKKCKELKKEVWKEEKIKLDKKTIKNKNKKNRRK